MTKTLIMLTGWVREEETYGQLIKSVPSDWQIKFFHHEEDTYNKDFAKLAEKFAEFLKANNLTKVYLMGHSLGGAIALEIASRQPELIEKLFLIDSAGIYGAEGFFEAAKNFLLSQTVNQHLKIKLNLKTFYRLIKNPIFHSKIGHYAYQINLIEEALSLKVPTTIFWGQKDYLLPLWKGARLQELIPKSKLIVLPEMDHDWIMHSPQLFWKNINDK